MANLLSAVPPRELGPLLWLDDSGGSKRSGVQQLKHTFVLANTMNWQGAGEALALYRSARKANRLRHQALCGS